MIGCLAKLHKAAHTNIILSSIGFIVNGITPDNILNCFNFKIILSTWDLKEATHRVWVAPREESLGPQQYAGEIKLTFSITNKSLTKKPLSAMTASPSSSRLTKPEFLTISLSDTDPVHRRGINEITPVGVIPTRSLAVFQCL